MEVNLLAAPKVIAIFGTRPEAIKMAPLVNLLQSLPQLDTKVIVTAQHREMLDQVLELFNIQPDYDLNIMHREQSLFDITTRALTGLGTILAQEKPDLVLVHGDTTTTFAGALAAFYHQLKVGHVEAGLRTRKKYSPFPEEMNRRLTGAIADLHFAPTATARANLLAEAVPQTNIFVTGNTVIDALLSTVEREYDFSNEEKGLAELVKAAKLGHIRLVLATVHRRESWGRPMQQVFRAFADLVKAHPEVEIVFPVHRNPKVRTLAKEILGQFPRVHLIAPLEYAPFANLMAHSHLVLTDSGGLQEEAPALGKPVLVLRETTERPEAIKAGTVRLVGTSTSRIVSEANRLLEDPRAYAQMANAVNPYGDGKACWRIAQIILHGFGLAGELPEEFASPG